MVHFDLLASPPGIPRGFGIFFFPSGLFPTPGNAVGGNSPAPSSWSTSYRFFSRYIFLAAIVISYNNKTRRFQNFHKGFSRVYWEKDNTWQLKHEQHVWKRKERKKKLLSASLIEHFILTLDWIFVYLYTTGADYGSWYTGCPKSSFLYFISLYFSTIGLGKQLII